MVRKTVSTPLLLALGPKFVEILTMAHAMLPQVLGTLLAVFSMRNLRQWLMKTPIRLQKIPEGMSMS